MVGHFFQNYDTTYTCNHSCYTIYVRFLLRIYAFFPALWGFYSQVYDHFLTNAHIYAHKKAHIYELQHVVYGSQKVVVWEAPNYTVSKKPLHVRKIYTWANWYLRDILCKLNENELDNHEIKVEEQGKRGRWKAIKVWEYKTRNMEFIEWMEGKNTKLRD